MNKTLLKRNTILGILFFLPVTFLLFLYPATHNYTPLDIVNTPVLEVNAFTSLSGQKVVLKDQITVLGFLGQYPKKNSTVALNLKELIYDKFKGFKKFQIVIVMPNGSEAEAEALKKEISSYEDSRFWHFVFAEPQAVERVFFSLKSKTTLKPDLSLHQVFIIDKDLNQRGRLDDRTDNELKKKAPIYGLYAYNCVEVSEIKNKMSDDLRILFTEYRQKRKGEFNSDTRRAADLNKKDEKES